MLKKAVCLLSGGIDSAVSSYIAKKNNFEIYALSFSYGQKHDKELRSSKKIAKSLKAKKHIIFPLDLSVFKGSSLYQNSNEVIQENLDLSDIGKNIPSTYVPARNTVFLSIALSLAESLDADSIFIGVTTTDYSGYPDCRSEYIKAYQIMADLATKKGVEGNSITIETPLINLTKSDIIKKGIELKVPLKYTWSCYQGKDKACGKCDSCLLRLKGFKQAGLKDPIEYDSYPNWY